MSKAYWVVRVSVRDPERYPDYLQAATPAFEKFGASFVVRGGPYEAMEGIARDRDPNASPVDLVVQPDDSDLWARGAAAVAIQHFVLSDGDVGQGAYEPR